MGFLQAYKMAIKSIFGNKVRSFLTMLGVIIGVGSVIAAVAFAQGSTASITSSLQGMGTNLIQISIVGRNSNRNLSYEELKKFAEENSSLISALAPQITGNATAKYGTATSDTSLIGTSAEYEVINSRHVQSGRFLTSLDDSYMQKVAVVGTAVVKELFVDTKADPIGQKIKISGEIFKVVGILEEKANGQDQGADDRIIIPVTVAKRLSKQAVIRDFSVQASSPEVVDMVMEKLTAFLTKIYKDETAFRVFNQEEAISTLNDVTGAMMMVLGGIAAISLVVGGIGIMNIMLVSVTERTREIGIRKAIGAKRKNILVQFLIEAIMVTGIGGLVGVLLGVSIIKFLIGGLKLTTPVYSPFWMILSFGISLLVGITFGMFPAYKAARLNPIEALRFE